jgi:glutathione S-transferase
MRLYDYEGSANAYKIRLLLALLDATYERVPVEIFRGESRTPEFLAKNPAGRVPVVELDDGTVLPESNAILWRLAHETTFAPVGIREEAEVLRWMFFEQSEIEPNVGSVRFWILTGRAAARGDELARRLDTGRRALAAMNDYLAGRRFVVGERLTIADVALYAYSHLAADAGIELTPLTALCAWFTRVEAQPRYVPGPGPYSERAHIR